VAPEILSVDYWSDANNWFALCDPMILATIEIGFLDSEEEPEILLQDDPRSGTMFSHDKRTYKVRHVYGGVVRDFRGVQGAIVT
jgi:hypothetical protein